MRRQGAANPFHPELRRIAAFLPRTLVTPLTISAFRMLPRRRAGGEADGVDVVTLDSGVGTRIHRPRHTASGPALLWIHGGGYVLGHAAMDDKHCRRLADELGATIAAVEYRLAPEHPYPAAIDDCLGALKRLAHEPTVDSRRIAVAGASAGGGLAAAVAQQAHDRSEIALAAQVLVYPMLDDRTGSSPDPSYRNRRLWNSSSNRLGWQAYLGAASATTAAPSRRGDLTGLPPAWIGVGTLDILHDEAVDYAKRLAAADVPCKLEVVPGAFHGFDAAAPKTALAQSFFASQLAFLRRAFDSV
jgi:acetyl esterase/lipase